MDDFSTGLYGPGDITALTKIKSESLAPTYCRIKRGNRDPPKGRRGMNYEFDYLCSIWNKWPNFFSFYNRHFFCRAFLIKILERDWKTVSVVWIALNNICFRRCEKLEVLKLNRKQSIFPIWLLASALKRAPDAEENIRALEQALVTNGFAAGFRFHPMFMRNNPSRFHLRSHPSSKSSRI